MRGITHSFPTGSSSEVCREMRRGTLSVDIRLGRRFGRHLPTSGPASPNLAEVTAMVRLNCGDIGGPFRTSPELTETVAGQS